VRAVPWKEIADRFRPGLPDPGHRLATAVRVAALLLVVHMANSARMSLQTLPPPVDNPDFESGDLSGWTRTGNAFMHEPTLLRGAGEALRSVADPEETGEWLVAGLYRYQGKQGQKAGDTFGDRPVGTLTSEPFVIRGDYMSFLVGGGRNPWRKPDGDGSTCVNLLVGGQVARTATGDGSERLGRRVWRTTLIRGREAKLQLVDKNAEKGGHLNFDGLTQLTRWDMAKWDYCIWMAVVLIVMLATWPWAVAADARKVLLTALGAVVLLVALPQAPLPGVHSHGWEMANVKSVRDGFATISVTAGPREMTFSVAGLAFAFGFLFASLGVLSPQVRAGFRALVRSRLRLAAACLAVAGLAATLIPTREGWPIVLYLAFGTSGMLALLLGLAGPVSALVRLGRAPAKWIAQRFNEARPGTLLGVIGGAVLLVAAIVAVAVFERIPHVEDGICRMFHARMLSMGKLAVPSPPAREFFDYPYMINDGQWYSMFLPGHTILLALGRLVRAPWLVNPLLGAVSILLLYLLGKEMFDDRTGRLAALLGALSPFLLLMSSEYMSHAATLCLFELFLLAFVRMVKRRRKRDSVLAGAAVGYALLVHPLTAAATALPFMLYWVYELYGQFRMSQGRGWRFLERGLETASVAGLFFAALLAFNFFTNGHPLLFGGISLLGEQAGLGFGRGLDGIVHTPALGFVNMLDNLNALNRDLFAWPIPSLVFVAVALVSISVTRWDYLLAVSAVSLALAYVFYWFQDWCFGPRLVYEATAPLVLLTARGILAVPRVARDVFGIGSRRAVKGTLAVLLLLCVALGLLTALPAAMRLYGHDYRGVNRDVQRAVRSRGITNAVVLVRGEYGGVFAENDPLLRSTVIYARDLGDGKNAKLMRKFEDRDFFTADGGQLEPLRQK